MREESLTPPLSMTDIVNPPPLEHISESINSDSLLKQLPKLTPEEFKTLSERMKEFSATPIEQHPPHEQAYLYYIQGKNAFHNYLKIIQGNHPNFDEALQYFVEATSYFGNALSSPRLLNSTEDADFTIIKSTHYMLIQIYLEQAHLYENIQQQIPSLKNTQKIDESQILTLQESQLSFYQLAKKQIKLLNKNPNTISSTTVLKNNLLLKTDDLEYAIGNAYLRNENLNESLLLSIANHFEQSIKIKTRLKNYRKINDIKLKLAKVYENLGDFYKTPPNESLSTAISYYTLGVNQLTSLDSNDSQTAHTDNPTSIRSIAQFKNNLLHQIADLTYTLGITCFDRNEFDQSVSHLTEAIAILNRLRENNQATIKEQTNLAHAYFKQAIALCKEDESSHAYPSYEEGHATLAKGIDYLPSLKESLENNNPYPFSPNDIIQRLYGNFYLKYNFFISRAEEADKQYKVNCLQKAITAFEAITIPTLADELRLIPAYYALGYALKKQEHLYSAECYVEKAIKTIRMITSKNTDPSCNQHTLQQLSLCFVSSLMLMAMIYRKRACLGRSPSINNETAIDFFEQAILYCIKTETPDEEYTHEQCTLLSTLYDKWAECYSSCSVSFLFCQFAARLFKSGVEEVNPQQLVKWYKTIVENVYSAPINQARLLAQWMEIVLKVKNGLPDSPMRQWLETAEGENEFKSLFKELSTQVASLPTLNLLISRSYSFHAAIAMQIMHLNETITRQQNDINTLQSIVTHQQAIIARLQNIIPDLSPENNNTITLEKQSKEKEEHKEPSNACFFSPH